MAVWQIPASLLGGGSTTDIKIYDGDTVTDDTHPDIYGAESIKMRFTPKGRHWDIGTNQYSEPIVNYIQLKKERWVLINFTPTSLSIIYLISNNVLFMASLYIFKRCFRINHSGVNILMAKQSADVCDWHSVL